ncbi:transcriptional regulator, GntR family [Alteromonadaceae bacterium Bs31]|nr:transcriptional regulator, GntR family [Alteromonadaceae bacterium Bs31]
MSLESGNPQISYTRSTSEQIFDYLRDEIIRMDLLPGEKIPENLLAEKFGVSRTPVRAALAELSSNGFVEIRPQRGTFVTKLSINLILEARFIREALEVAVVSHVAENQPPGIIEKCEQVFAEQSESAKAGDPLKFQRLDDKFHSVLADATGFGRVSKVIEAEKAHMDRLRNLSLQEFEGQYDHVLEQHRVIITAIKSGSGTSAKNAMETHMRDVFAILSVAPEKHPDYFY